MIFATTLHVLGHCYSVWPDDILAQAFCQYPSQGILRVIPRASKGPPFTYTPIAIPNLKLDSSAILIYYATDGAILTHLEDINAGIL
jgi:hypothetical protein